MRDYRYTLHCIALIRKIVLQIFLSCQQLTQDFKQLLYNGQDLCWGVTELGTKIRQNLKNKSNECKNKIHRKTGAKADVE